VFKDFFVGFPTHPPAFHPYFSAARYSLWGRQKFSVSGRAQLWKFSAPPDANDLAHFARPGFFILSSPLFPPPERCFPFVFDTSACIFLLLMDPARPLENFSFSTSSGNGAACPRLSIPVGDFSRLVVTIPNGRCAWAHQLFPQFDHTSTRSMSPRQSFFHSWNSL